MHNYFENRGGYQFCPADKELQSLEGKAGIDKTDRILSVFLTFNNGKKSYQLPLLFPDKPYNPSAFQEIRFELSMKINFDGKSWPSIGPIITFQRYEFLDDRANPINDLKENLKTEYGNLATKPPLHARDYTDFVNGASPVSVKFLEHLNTAHQFITGKIPADAKYSIKKSELAAALFCEGANVVLEKAIKNKTDPDTLKFSGYNDLGIDSYVTAWKKNTGNVRLFTPKVLEDKINVPSEIEKITNEKGDTFQTFKSLTLLESIHAVGCMYTNSKALLSADLADAEVMGEWVCKTSDLPLHVQHFWVTIYLNTGSGNGKKTLSKHGLEYHDLIWKQEDDHAKYQGYEKYNANWRTATFRLLDVIMSP